MAYFCVSNFPAKLIVSITSAIYISGKEIFRFEIHFCLFNRVLCFIHDEEGISLLGCLLIIQHRNDCFGNLSTVRSVLIF